MGQVSINDFFYQDWLAELTGYYHGDSGGRISQSANHEIYFNINSDGVVQF